VRHFIFRCTSKGLNVQGSFEEDEPPKEGAAPRAVTCLACGLFHFVDPVTCKLLADRDD
jgi:hypothetical protein